jgi:DNA-directed RNA polymerase specialized sigma24 family protein
MAKNKQHPVEWQNVKEIKSKLDYSQWLEKYGKRTEDGEIIEDQRANPDADKRWNKKHPYSPQLDYSGDCRDPLDILIERESRGEIAFKLSTVQDSLTYQQEKVLSLLEQGYKEQEIADYMYISASAIHNHIEAIRKKTRKVFGGDL